MRKKRESVVLYGLVPARESLGHISYVTPIAGDGARTHDSLLPLLSHNTTCRLRERKREKPVLDLSQWKLLVEDLIPDSSDLLSRRFEPVRSNADIRDRSSNRAQSNSPDRKFLNGQLTIIFVPEFHNNISFILLLFPLEQM